MIDVTNLQNAYNTLKESYEVFEKNLDSEFIAYIQDSCVKRFEYTLETAWKLAKRILKENFGKTEEELSLNNIFRYMEGYGYTTDWTKWKNYYQMRNNTAHEYNIEKSREIIDIIPDFLADLEFFISKIRTEND